MKAKNTTLAALTIASLTLSHSSAFGVIAMDISGGLTAGFGNNVVSAGYAFTVDSAITVESLLFYDYLSDGFNGGSLTVSIFSDDGTTVPVSGITATFNGSSSNYFLGDTPPSGSWLEINIADKTLVAGDYTIIAQGTINEFAGDRIVYQATIAGTPEVTFAGSRAEFGVGNPSSDAFGLSNSYFGPNFTYSPVPEFSSFALIAGLSALGFLATRRRSN